MAYCDFCPCSDCQTGKMEGGDLWYARAKTEDGRWICCICYDYEVCKDAKRKALGIKHGEKSPRGCGPCEEEVEIGEMIAHVPILCEHRPKLVSEWSKGPLSHAQID